MAEFARRRFGSEAANIFVDALVTGIHAGDPEKLSVRAAFPRLPKMEAEAGSVFRGFLRSAKHKKLAAQARGAKIYRLGWRSSPVEGSGQGEQV